MDCCSIANTCVISFVTSLAALLVALTPTLKKHLFRDENNQLDSKKNKKENK